MRGKWRCSPTHAPSGSCSFNEARALCAGNVRRSTPEPARHDTFNEARALCAGNGRAAKKDPNRGRAPSMRPALCAREMITVTAGVRYDDALQ